MLSAISTTTALCQPRWRDTGSVCKAVKGSANLRAVQLLLGHTKVDSTVCYFGVELEDALSIAKRVDTLILVGERRLPFANLKGIFGDTVPKARREPS